MDEEEINYRTLRKIQQLERNTPLLTNLKTDFYKELTNFIEELNQRFEKESDSQKKMLLEDEIQNTKKIAVNIYEQREKKIMLAAISKARSGKPDEKNMLSAEKELFDSILNHMQKSRSQIFENKKCEKNNDIQEDNKKEQTEEKKENIKEKNIDETVSNTNPVLMITQDIPEFVGTDTKKYNIRKDDLLSTPEDMADMLCKRKAAEKIEF